MQKYKRHHANSDFISITKLKPFQKGFIAFLSGNRKIVQRLSDLGLIRKTEVEVIRKTPLGGPIEVLVRRTTIAMARDIAENIFVVPVGAK
jgi:DtxR family Mn-dependent transcriptional regulator